MILYDIDIILYYYHILYHDIICTHIARLVFFNTKPHDIIKIATKIVVRINVCSMTYKCSSWGAQCDQKHLGKCLKILLKY